MPEIRQLPTSVINKIAAGEVIERPASVVKELLENAVDSGARRIEVALGQGGGEYVRVSDDGCGIAPEQLPLAVASHATSKIRDADDLFHVATLGFRGEALASISEVSRFLIRSRLPDATAGAQLEVIGGSLSAVEPCGCGPGTTIEVRDLFFNTPVRRKFLRAAQTETGHATEAFTRVALAAPDVHFVFKHNDRVLYDLPPASSWRERIAAFFGREVGQALIATEGSDGELSMSGYVGDPQISRPNNRLQYLFLNGRCIRDRSLQHALGEAYRGLLLTGRFPVAFLRLEMPAELVDVNVHPTKLEVRFQDSGRIYGHLLGTIRRKFLGTDLTARVAPAPADDVGAGGRASSFSAAGPDDAPAARPESTTSARGGERSGQRDEPPVAPFRPFESGGRLRGEEAHDPREAARRRDELLAWAQGRLPLRVDEAPPAEPSRFEPGRADAGRGDAPRFDAARFGPASPLGALSPALPGARPFDFTVPPAAEGCASSDLPGGGPKHASESAPSLPSGVRPGVETSTSSAAGSSRSGRRPLGVQLHDRYLVAEDEAGILVIDQHALHERVLYEQLRAKLATGRFETQKLLVPLPVALTGAEAAVLLDAREALANVGIDVEPFGGSTVLVTSYPAMLARLRPDDLVRQVLDRLMAGGKTIDRQDLVDELLHMISCKAAVKAGDPLTSDEVEALLAQRHLFQDTHHCPHGRPTALVFTCEELDKRFKRI